MTVTSERTLLELAAAVGGITGVVSGQLEKEIHPASRVLNWKASIPAFIAAGILYALKQNKLAVGVAGFGAGVLASDPIGLVMQTGTPWENRSVFIRGTQRNIKLPAWRDGRTLEECMVDPYIVDAAWRGRLNQEVRKDVFRVLDEKKLDGRDFVNVITALQQDQIKNMKYAHDPKLTEIFQEAYKSLELKRGDCDDHTILMASKLMSIGIPVKLVILSFDANFKPDTSRYGHILCIATVQGKDYWVETIKEDAVLDYRPESTGRIEFNLVSPSKTEMKKISEVKMDVIAGLSDLVISDSDMDLISGLV